jgi:hypothetical protein
MPPVEGAIGTQKGTTTLTAFVFLLPRRRGYNAIMTILLPVLATAFAAVCVWLAVRIVNRRERWAKWTLAAVVALPAIYVSSFWPACRLITRVILPANAALPIYRPLLRLCDSSDQFRSLTESFVSQDDDANPGLLLLQLLYFLEDSEAGELIYPLDAIIPPPLSPEDLVAPEDVADR